MDWKIAVENIKCGGCAASIRNALLELDGVSGAAVDVAKGEVHVYAPKSLRPVVAARLRELGYPEPGAASGMSAAAAKARSFVSCAVGRLS